MADMALRRAHRRGAILSLAVAVATALTACLGPLFPGECSDEERAAFESFEPYGADPPAIEADALGGCRTSFDSDADPQGVIAHYESALEEAGWAVDRAYEGPIEDESGDRTGTVFDLGASKGPMAATVTGTLFDGEPTSWVVLVRRVSG